MDARTLILLNRASFRRPTDFLAPWGRSIFRHAFAVLVTRISLTWKLRVRGSLEPIDDDNCPNQSLWAMA
jgi:hypothetical protein